MVGDPITDGLRWLCTRDRAGGMVGDPIIERSGSIIKYMRLIAWTPDRGGQQSTSWGCTSDCCV